MLRRSHLCHDPGRDPAHSVGPRLSATLSYFSGCHGVSKRGVEQIAETVLGVPIALGTVANLEQEVAPRWPRLTPKLWRRCVGRT